MSAKTLSFRKLVKEFKKQAEIQDEGKTVRLAGYTATRGEEFFSFWEITEPSHQPENGKPAFPGNMIVPEGGCLSRRSAIAVMAKCAAEEVIKGKRPSPCANRR